MDSEHYSLANWEFNGLAVVSVLGSAFVFAAGSVLASRLDEVVLSGMVWGGSFILAFLAVYPVPNVHQRNRRGRGLSLLRYLGGAVLRGGVAASVRLLFEGVVIGLGCRR